MTVSRLMAVAPLLTLALVGQHAFAEEEAPAPSMRSQLFNVSATVLLVQQDTNVHLKKGSNAVGAPTTVSCASANGCSIRIDSVMTFNDTGRNGEGFTDYRIDSFADGVKANPKSTEVDYQGLVHAKTLQFIDIAQGDHVVSTQLFTKGNVSNGFSGTLYKALIIYTIYDH